MSGYIYLASPYTHVDPVVRENRYRAVCKAAARLMLDGHVVFSPIAHGHSVESIGLQQAMSGDFWKKQCVPMLHYASEVMVLTLNGHTESVGVAWELETARALHIPITYIDPYAGG